MRQEQILYNTLCTPQEFLRLLAAFSPRAPQDMKLQHMFSVYDVDGDGIISLDDLELVTRMLAGNALTYVSCCHAVLNNHST